MLDRKLRWAELLTVYFLLCSPEFFLLKLFPRKEESSSGHVYTAAAILALLLQVPGTAW